jgi:predicted Rossmann fold flavoprotein
MNKYDVLILGAGAAGLTAAIFAAQRGLNVMVLEKAPMAGRKILMSGGTRCNVLPVEVDIRDFVTTSSPNLLNKVFKSWSLEACHRWFTDNIGLDMVTEEASNKWFPASNSAKEVRDLLLDAAIHAGARFRYNSGAKSIERSDNGTWVVTTFDGTAYSAHAVILATGGLSVPTTGTDGDGHRMLQTLGQQLVPTYPALTPLTGEHPGHDNLAGLSLEVGLRVVDHGKQVGTSNRRGFLFTHRGFSGPAVLDVSHWVVNDPSVGLEVDWLAAGAQWWEEQLGPSKTHVHTRVREFLPERLARAIMEESGIPAHRNLAELGKADRKKLVDLLCRYPLHPAGHEGYKKAEVTGGGVRLEDIDTASMEHRLLPGLYVCGEIVDVFGRIGGFNFYWAWVSGRLAGMAANSNHFA